jgi:hypothetical protein
MKKIVTLVLVLFIGLALIAASVAAPGRVQASVGNNQTVGSYAYSVFFPFMRTPGQIGVNPPVTCVPDPIIADQYVFKTTHYNTSIGYEDLDLSSLYMDFDYNDWITDIATDLCYYSYPNSTLFLWQLDFTILPQARGAALDHAYHIDFPANIFPSDGEAILTRYDENNNIIGVPVLQPFTANQVNQFTMVDPTSNALPGSMVNTIESEAYVNPRGYATLSIRFDTPFFFDVSLYDPAQAGNEHGEKLFFQPHLFVYNNPNYEIGPGSPLMLVVPFLTWEWPEERVNIWLAYPDVIPGDLSVTPHIPPVFPLNWTANFNDCVYNGVPCTLPPVAAGAAQLQAPSVTPSPSPEP